MIKDGPLFILAGNGPYENRGCEAIVRGTVKIIRAQFRNPRFICISHFQSERQFNEQCQSEVDYAIAHLAACKLNKKVLINNLFRPEIWTGLCQYYFSHDNFYSWVYKDMISYIQDSSAVLSIGGDNYSLDYGVPKLFTSLDDIVYARGKPHIIWGASVGPFSAMPDYEQYMSRHLRRVTGIFARESATIEYLRSIGVTENVCSVADPAFLIDPVKPKGIKNELPIEKEAIGINLSPLMAKYMTCGNLELWTKMSAAIIETILKIIEVPIYLIPHVTIAGSDDYAFMQSVLSLIHQKKNNLILVPPIYNAAEIKWIISQMTLFAGARTHSTIAALSSGVPTLSFAYSIKAQGINRDIFGHTAYCLNPTDINAKRVSDQMKNMLDQDAGIRRELNERIPIIQKSAGYAGIKLRQTIEKN